MEKNAITHRRMLLTLLSLLGLSSVIATYFSKDIVAYISTTADATDKLSVADACTSESEAEEDLVFSAGCGGFF